MSQKKISESVVLSPVSGGALILVIDLNEPNDANKGKKLTLDSLASWMGTQIGGGASDWGDLGGNIQDQVDLYNALQAKADLVGGKIPANQIPAIATLETVLATEATLAAFAANHLSYTYEKGDYIVINDANPKEFYFYIGGDPTDVNNYLKSTPTKVEWSEILNIPDATTLAMGIVQLVDNLTTNDDTKALTAAQGKVLNDNKAGNADVDTSFTNLGDGSGVIDLSVTNNCFRRIIKRTLNEDVTNVISFDSGTPGIFYELHIETNDNGYTNIGFASNVEPKDGVPVLIPDNGGTHVYQIYHKTAGGYDIYPIYEEV